METPPLPVEATGSLIAFTPDSSGDEFVDAETPTIRLRRSRLVGVDSNELIEFKHIFETPNGVVFSRLSQSKQYVHFIN